MPPPVKSFAAPGGIISYEALLSQGGTNVPVEQAVSPQNTIKDVVWGRTQAGIYTISSPSYPLGWEYARSILLCMGGTAVFKPVQGIVADGITIYTFSAAGALADMAGEFYVSFKNWPK